MKLTVLSLGAGVQSSMMALMASRGELLRPDGTPWVVDCAIFADTQHEPRHTKVQHPDGYWIEGGVYGWLDWLEKQLNFPVYRVSAGDLAEESLVIRQSKKTDKIYIKNFIPAFIKAEGEKEILFGRKCTDTFKIKPIQRKVKELLGVSRVTKKFKGKVNMLMGISTDEAQRMKPSRLWWIENHYPLIDMNISRDECEAWFVQNRLPIAPRSACYFCPFHSDHEWVNLKENSPIDFQSAVEFEKDLQFFFKMQNSYETPGLPWLHRSGIPLDQIEFKESDINQVLDAFGNECEGLCGV